MKRPLPADAAPGFFRDSAAVAEGWRRSVECATVLNATALLFQCPASFGPDRENVDQMRRFFERLARLPARLLWEPRGARWVAERSLALSLCRELDLVHVVDPFVTAPDPAQPVYWRLHGSAGPRSSYSQVQLRQLRDNARRHRPSEPGLRDVQYLPRVGDARRLAELVAGCE